MIAIDEHAKMGRMHDKQTIMVPHQATRRVDVAENLCLVGAIVAISITQPNHASAVGFSAQRTVAIATDIECAIRSAATNTG